MECGRKRKDRRGRKRGEELKKKRQDDCDPNREKQNVNPTIEQKREKGREIFAAAGFELLSG